MVEESGWLRELQVICDRHQHNFDILHLTGVVDSHAGKACLLTEDQFGDRCYSSAEDIANAIGRPFPRLILLCADAEYSSEERKLTTDLISQGAEAILTFGDEFAEVLIAKLYEELARGGTLDNALKLIYRQVYPQSPLLSSPKSSICLYLADTKLLSTPFVTKGQKPQPTFALSSGFRDSAQRMRVVDRSNFVGRRRQLQNCLKALKIDTDKVGVILHGMGGLGKSTIASRLICDRLPEYQSLIWSQWGQEKQKREPLKSTKLLAELSKYLFKERDLQQYLKGTDLEIDLSNLFYELSERGRLLVLIFDDFEWNLEPDGGDYRILDEPAHILKAVVNAIITSQTHHKIIITCRYDNFDDGEILSLFYSQGLDKLSEVDREKKLRQLENFNSDKMPPEIIERAIALANDNPRLLEDLNEKVLSLPPAEAEKLLTEYQNKPELWQDRVIWRDLYVQIDEPLSKVLSYGLIYQLPVHREFLQVACEDGNGEQIQRGINLGLIEESSDKLYYRISPILPRVLDSIKLPNDGKKLWQLTRRAYEQINTLWGNKENKNEERWAEIFRLAFADKENSERFREQFTKMILVQYNSEADLAYEKELKKEKEYLMENQGQIYQKLEECLKQQDWKKADYETAFIMYQLMVIENYDDFYYLFRGVSLDVINEIDRLWMQYSNQQFGIKEQAKIYHDLGGTERYNEEIWNRFGDRVGWRQGEHWLELEEVAYRTTETHNYHLPVRFYVLPCRIGGRFMGAVGFWVGFCTVCCGMSLFSRVET